MHDEKYYEDLGFKCGLEIHQRLATTSKLFCSCDAMLPKDARIATIERRQRAVAGELGRIDASATYETTRGRRFIYNAFRKTVCLVDMDEEPPHELNLEALDIALQVAAEFDSAVPSEIQPMRKEVVNGSDPSAFQRTMLVGYNSHLTVDKKRINISAIFLEEESCGIERSDSGAVVYNLDRLGVPLIEIDTDPDIRTPLEAKEVARRIGLMLRLTGKVQRGIGSIRQDVNVSIRDGARVEIKGFQDLDTTDLIIEREIERQQKLIEIRKLLEGRKAKAHAPKEVTKLLKDTKVGVLRKNIDGNGVVFAARLQGFEGLLGFEINPDRRLGSEISDYAKLAGVGGIIHSDEDLVHYEFADAEISALKKELGVAKGDAFIMVSGGSEVCRKAVELAARRAEQAITGVPNETRGVDNKRLVTVFMRPLPGGSRMYPETDVRPIPVDAAKYEALKKSVTDPDEVARLLEKETGNKQLADQMLWSPYLTLFKEVLTKTGVDGSVVAPVLLEKIKEAKRNGVDVERISDEAIIRMFDCYSKEKITKAAMAEIIKHTPEDAKSVDEIIRKNGLERISGKGLKAIISKLGKKSKDEIVRALMAKHRLNVDGDELNRLLESYP